MSNIFYDHPNIAFIIVATAITLPLVLLRLVFKFRLLLWKSTLISYILFVIFMLIAPIYEHDLLKTPFSDIYRIYGAVLIIPGMLIQGLIFGVGPCPIGDYAEFVIDIAAFIFYAIVIWGIMKIIKINKEPQAIEQKQDDNMKQQTSSETET
jgi:hypothetical protein